MMKDNYKKTFLGSVISFMLATSCCWISSLAIWIGGATVLGTIASFVGNIQIPLMLVGGMLASRTVFLFYKRR